MLSSRILDGLLYDGTGAPPRVADIGIEGDRITAIGDLSRVPAETTLGANGLIVCPGFIDVHTHSDAYILIEPSAPSKIFQGVTTEITGNCGCSAAPHFGSNRLPGDWEAHDYPGDWHTVAEYRRWVESISPAPNIVMLAGHNTIRSGVMGYAARSARPDEIAAMVRHLEQAFDEGVRGISLGLVYSPGRHAQADELDALAAVATRRGGLLTAHMRSETRRLIEALDEIIGIGRRTGVRLQVSHLKASGRRNWGLLDTAIERVRQARRDGLDLQADRYPYLYACTDLDIIFPDWAAEGGREAILGRLRDPALRARLRQDLIADHDETYWRTITIGSSPHPEGVQGRPLLEIADRLGMHPADTVLHLCDAGELRTSAFFESMCRDNLLRVLEQPWVMIGSDASLRAPKGPLSHDWPHPRAYGTFPRFLRMALDGETVAPEDAIRKMTALPARTFDLKERGELRRGFYADVLVLDPGRIRDRSTRDRPHALAGGVRHLWVNGVQTVAEGTLTGKRGGQCL